MIRNVFGLCRHQFAELAAILRGVFIRRPRIVIYENSCGLWRCSSVWRKRVESLLCGDRSYAWESMEVSPELHCGINVRRKRVIYVGVLQDAGEAPDHSEFEQVLEDQHRNVESEDESDMELFDDDWEEVEAWESEYDWEEDEACE